MNTTAKLLTSTAALCASAGLVVADDASEEAASAFPLKSSIENVTVEGLIEVSASYSKQGSDKDTDINVDTVELDLGFEASDRLSASIAFLYEEGEEDDHVIVDSADIVYSLDDDFSGLSLHFGKIYMPFGVFETGLISDPLTLELGEISDGAVGLEWESDLLDLAAYAFAGDINDETDDSEELQYVASATLKPFEGLSFKAAVLSDICEAALDDDVSDRLKKMEEEGSDPTYDGAIGVDLAAVLEVGDFKIAAEYLGAAEQIKFGGVESGKPRTWSVDLVYSLTDRLSLAARYEGSKEFAEDEMPEKQFGVGGEYAFTDNFALALEYLYGEFEKIDGEQPDDRHMGTAKVAFSF